MAFESLGVALEVKGFQAFNSNMKDVEKSISGISGASKEGFSVLNLLSSGVTAVATAAVAAGAALAGAFVGGMGIAIKEAADAEKIWMNLAGAIEASGTGISLELSHQLAMTFRDLAGGSDEAVASIIEMGIRMGAVNEDQLPAFIQNTLDLAVATGKDYPESAKIMALAMEDPDGAFRQLRMSGILFNDELQEQIKNELKAGNKAKAMTLFMNRLSESIGGRAAKQSKTFNAQLVIMKNHIGEVFEEIGGKLLPVLSPLIEKLLEIVDRVGPKLIGFFETNLLPIIQNVADAIGVALTGDFEGALKTLGVPQEVIDTWNWLKDTFNGVWSAIQLYLLPVFDKIKAWWDANGKSVRDKVSELVGAFGELAREGLITAIQQIGGAIETAFKWLADHREEILGFVDRFAQWIMDNKEQIIAFLGYFAVTMIVGDLIAKVSAFITLLLGAAPAIAIIGGIAAGLTTLTTVNLNPTTQSLEDMSQAMRGADLTPWETFIANLNGAAVSARQITLLPSALLSQLLGVDLVGPVNSMLDNFATAVQTGDWTAVTNAWKAGFSRILETVLNALFSVGGVGEIGTTFTSGIIQGIMTGNWQGVRDAFTNMLGGITSQIGSFLQTGANIAAQIINGISGGLTNAYNTGRNFISNVASGISSMGSTIYSAAVNIASQAISGISNMASSSYNAGYNFVIQVVNGINSLANTVYSYARNIGQQALNGVSSFASSFYSAGYSMIQSLASGIGSMGSTLYNAAYNVARNAYYAILRALGLGSPSPLFINAGEMTIKSIEMGVNNEAQKLISQMQNIAGGMLAATSVAAPMNSMTSNVNYNFNYSPTYGATPNNPEFDFSLMEARALA